MELHTFTTKAQLSLEHFKCSFFVFNVILSAHMLKQEVDKQESWQVHQTHIESHNLFVQF